VKPEVHNSTFFLNALLDAWCPARREADELGPKASPETLSAPPALLGDEMEHLSVP
jgi:hypothetical protein